MEKIIGIIPNVTKSKWLGFSNTSYTIVVTDKKSIFAKFTTELAKDIIAKARADAKQEGKGFFGQWGAQIAAGFTYSEKYWKMTPDDIIAEDPTNFTIDNSIITEIRYRSNSNTETTKNYSEIIIKTTAGKHHFTSRADIKKQLTDAYGVKVR